MFWKRKVGRAMFRPYELAVIDALLGALPPEARAIVARQIEATTHVQRILDDTEVDISAEKGKLGSPDLALPNRAPECKLATIAVQGAADPGKVTIGAVYGHVFELDFHPSPKQLRLGDSIEVTSVKLHIDPMAPDDPAARIESKLASLDPAIRRELERAWSGGSAADIGLLEPEGLYEVQLGDGTWLMLGQLPDTTFVMARIDPRRPGVGRFEPEGDVIGHDRTLDAALIGANVRLRTAATTAKAPATNEPSTPPPAPSSKGMSLADSSPRPLHAYLEYVGGTSSKFYAVAIDEEASGTWRVRFNFGRIGFPRAWGVRVEGASWARAATAYVALIDEKRGKGYELREWPAYLRLPEGADAGSDESSAAGGVVDDVLFRAMKRGSLPPPTGGSIAGISLPDGTLYAPMPEGGSRGGAPVIWVSAAKVARIDQTWARLAAAFAETGVWPLVIDASFGFRGFDDYLMDMPRGRHTEVLSILRRGWTDMVADDDAFLEEIAPFGKQFPGLADPTPGVRPKSIDRIVANLEGHLGLVAVNRPADVLDAIGWMGAANYDGDPLNMTTVLRSWEVRFDAYLVGLGHDTMNLAVGRPPRDLASATAIAGEHYAFCPDNVQQGAESIREYARILVDQEIWPFWWD